MTVRARNLTLAGRLADVSLDLRAGEVTAICGPNGAGKSSLLAALAGLLALDAGSVSLDRDELGRLPLAERARRIGYLPQQGEVAWDVTVATLVALGRLPWKSGASEDREAIDAAIETMDLGGLRSRAVNRLSGGERARALLARVLAGTPRWVLADEPLANLDLAHQQALLARFRALAGEGLGVVLVLHDLAQAINHADRVVVLDGGQIVADGAAEATLTLAIIARVWKTKTRWLGVPGQRALVVEPD